MGWHEEKRGRWIHRDRDGKLYPHAVTTAKIGKHSEWVILHLPSGQMIRGPRLAATSLFEAKREAEQLDGVF